MLIKNEVNRLCFLEERAHKTEAKICVIGGAEFNIGQNIERWDKKRKLKWKMVGVHGWFIDREELTLEQLYSYYSDCAYKFESFSHIEREIDKVDHRKYGDKLTNDVIKFFDKIVELSKETGVILEVNESSLTSNKHGEYEKIRYWLERAKNAGSIISLGSDAHYCEEIGKFDNTLRIINEVKFPKERVLNCNEELIHKKFGIQIIR